MQTRDQKYAAKIVVQVEEVRRRFQKSESTDEPPPEQKQYGSMAHKLPILIRTAGLAQALEFVSSRGRDTQKLLLTHIAKAVCGEEANEQELLSRSRNAQLNEYMRLTQEIMGALAWYKRFAQSVLKVEAGDEAGTDRGAGGGNE